MLTQADYAVMTEQALRSRLASVRDRMSRADTMEAALADAFTEQEICAAMAAKGLSTYTGH